ncbi:60S ribosomal protein L13-2, putative, partial [Hepatocystis sp. ex Piliocolobus tephrosceles]
SIGIRVDKRRKNRCEESLKKNIDRLEQYKKCLVIIPKKKNKLKKNVGGIPPDADQETIKEARKKKTYCSIFKKERTSKPLFEKMEVAKIDNKFLAYKKLMKAKKIERKKNKRQQSKDIKRKSQKD